MKTFYLFTLLLWGTSSFAESFYFSQENKKLGLAFYKKQIYEGCTSPKKIMDPISLDEMKKKSIQVLKYVNEDFSKAFTENPLVKVALIKDLDALTRDSNCQRPGNDCRARLLGLSMFYFQRLRPDISGCQKYTPGSSPHSEQCEIELKFRTKNLKTVPKNYGAYGIGTYKEELKVTKNNTIRRIFNEVMYKDKVNLHVCEDDSNYKYAMNINDSGEYLEGLDPENDPNRQVPIECKEDKDSLAQFFIPTDFENRTTVGEDQVMPLKNKIQEFLKMNSELIVTEIQIVASSSKTPFYLIQNGKKLIDPKSREKNLTLAQERAFFAKKVLSKLKASDSQFAKINLDFKAALSGPEFEPINLNERFVTRMTPGYLERIEALYEKHKKEFQDKALKSSAMDLLDEKQFTNLYQAKFKPFQGYRLSFWGYKKEAMKCSGNTQEKKTFNRSSKQ